MIYTPEELRDMVDTLASIRAEIADLKIREESYRMCLIAAGVPQVDGTQHRATISSAYRVTIDWQTIAERLSPSPQLITAHTHKAAEPTYTLRLTGRKVAA